MQANQPTRWEQQEALLNSCKALWRLFVTQLYWTSTTQIRLSVPQQVKFKGDVVVSAAKLFRHVKALLNRVFQSACDLHSLDDLVDRPSKRRHQLRRRWAWCGLALSVGNNC
jgi:hypothetical protein